MRIGRIFDDMPRTHRSQGLSLEINSNQLCCGNTTKETSRPATHERLSDVIKSICRFIPSNGSSLVSLDEKTLLNRAYKQTGIESIGSESFHEALRVLLKSLESDAHLNFIGRVCAHSDILRMLCNRLRMEEDRRRHPQIADQIINRPLFITGLPRTGSTLLHALLAQDVSCRAPQTWEVMHPSPSPRGFPTTMTHALP